jgi:hypothetical protein
VELATHEPATAIVEGHVELPPLSGALIS